MIFQFLAAQSSHFKLLFKNSNDSEIALDGIIPEDFQNFLELLYGEPALTGRFLKNLKPLLQKYYFRGQCRGNPTNCCQI